MTTTARAAVDRALRRAIRDHLRPRGFTGSFPHLRRITDKRIDLITFQFYSAGGRFVVEVAACPPDGITDVWGTAGPKEVTAQHVDPKNRPRLEFADGDWLSFGPRTYDDPEPVRSDEWYAQIAAEVIRAIDEQAEPWWSSGAKTTP